MRRTTRHGRKGIAESPDDGAPWMYTLNVLHFRGAKIAREYLYLMEGFEAAEWPGPWATRFDPLASTAPSEWREGTAIGIEPDAGLAEGSTPDA